MNSAKLRCAAQWSTLRLQLFVQNNSVLYPAWHSAIQLSIENSPQSIALGPGLSKPSFYIVLFALGWKLKLLFKSFDLLLQSIKVLCNRSNRHLMSPLNVASLIKGSWMTIFDDAYFFNEIQIFHLSAKLNRSRKNHLAVQKGEQIC